MSTIKATTLSNLAGSKTVPTDTVVDGSAKAWVNFNGTGTVAVIIPEDCGLTIEQIAAKDVPAGKPYEIVDVADIPSDRTFRGAWSWAS